MRIVKLSTSGISDDDWFAALAHMYGPVIGHLPGTQLYAQPSTRRIILAGDLRVLEEPEGRAEIRERIREYTDPSLWSLLESAILGPTPPSANYKL